MAGIGRAAGDLGSSYDFFPITPNDNEDIPTETRWISVAVGGDLSVVLKDNVTVRTVTLAAGLWPTGGVQRVRATGTTATGIVGWV